MQISKRFSRRATLHTRYANEHYCYTEHGHEYEKSFDTFQFPDPGNDGDFDKATQLLSEYFEPQKNRLNEVYKFRQAQQGDTETIDQYHTRLQTLSKNCEFSDVEFEIMVQIVIGRKSSRVRKQALRDPKYVLKDLLLEARREQISKTQAADIEEHLDSHNLLAV